MNTTTEIQFPIFSNQLHPEDASHIPPAKQNFKSDRRLLRKLRSMGLDVVAGSTSYNKVVYTEDASAIMSMWARYRSQCDWPAFMSLVWRDQPDERDMTVTFLPNRDTMAVLLATRLGLQTEVAAALAHRDLIYFSQTDISERALTPSYHDSALLGTFTARNTGARFALFARAQAAAFSTTLKKHELVLLREGEDGLLRLQDETQITGLLRHSLRCRTDEEVSVITHQKGLSE